MVEELGIEVVPYYVHSTLGTLRDNVDLPPDEFYAWLKTTPDWPTTANPSAGEYLDAYRRAARRGDSVVVVSMSSVASGGYQSAVLAKRLAEQELPGLAIELVDTRQVAMAHGWAVIQAARAALRGLAGEQVAQVACDVANRAFVGFTNDTLEYLQRGGRIGRVTGLVGDLLSVKPVIGMREGMPASLGVARSRQGAYQRILALALNRVPAGSTVRVALMHVAAPDEVERLRPLVEEKYAVIEWVVAQLSPALGVHSGPGTVGISLIPDTV
jgi:DegV family protein with EDD domain